MMMTMTPDDTMVSRTASAYEAVGCLCSYMRAFQRNIHWILCLATCAKMCACLLCLYEAYIS